jgi:purine-binding chemotaxis protein CheW
VHTVLLPVGEDLYALPLGWVREVITVPPVTRLVTAPPTVLGLFNLRGEIVPMLDTAALLGVGQLGTATFCVVVNCPQGPLGLATTGCPKAAALDVLLGSSELPPPASTRPIVRSQSCSILPRYSHQSGSPIPT